MTPPYSYSWSNGATTQSISGNLSTGYISVIVTDSNGCVANGYTNITTQTPLWPSNNVVVLSPQVCELVGNMQVSGVTMTGANSYSWNNGATSQGVQNAQPGTYTCYMSGAYGCKDTLSGTILPPPPSPIISGTTSIDTSLISATGSVTEQVWHLDNDTVLFVNGYYVFYKDSVCQATKTDSVFLQTKNWQSVDSCSGVVLNNWMVDSSFVVTTYSDSCSVNTISMDTVLVTGIVGKNFGYGIRIYPNPVHDILYVDGLDDASGLVSFEIINILGQVILSGELSNEIDISMWSSGIYILNLNVGLQFWSSKIIKE